jgi:dTMP kinase
MSGSRGRFITFEGIDGAGKSTHVGWYAQRLRDRGLRVVETREPGGAPVAESLRELMLSAPMGATTELLLAFAARAEHLEVVIRPALAAGTWVVCDRFTDSTYAYQGGGRRVDWQVIGWLERLVHGDLQPDRTFLFDVPAEIAAARRAAARTADRFESEALSFFQRVRDAYARRAVECAERFIRIDGTSSIDDVRKLLEIYVASD